MIEFTLESGLVTQVECLPSLNLLGHAQLEVLEIGSRCGGQGVCGGDRVRILKGLGSLSPVTDAERVHLSESELAQGIRLACQCFPNRDVQETLIRVTTA